MPTLTPILLAFAIGLPPTGLWLSRLLGWPDPRSTGSGSTGATNVGRLAGARWGLLTALLDGLKGLGAVLVPPLLGLHGAPAAALGLAAVLAHVFSPLALFRGGKGVATGWGVALAIAPSAAAAGLLAQLLVLAGTRRMAPASLTGALLYAALASSGGPAQATAFAWGWLPLLLWTHRSNLARLAAGEEPPLWGAGRNAKGGDGR